MTMNAVDIVFGWACEKIDNKVDDAFLQHYYTGDLKEVPETEGDVEKWLDKPGNKESELVDQVRDLFYRFRDRGYDPARSLYGAMDMIKFLNSPEGAAMELLLNLGIEPPSDSSEGSEGDPDEDCPNCNETACPMWALYH